MGLLNSPIFVGDMQGQSSILEAAVTEITVDGSQDIHNTCRQPVEKVSWHLSDFFEDQEFTTDEVNGATTGKSLLQMTLCESLQPNKPYSNLK